MKRSVDTKKKVFNKSQYPKTIDTQFNQLGVVSITDAIADTLQLKNFSNYMMNYFMIFLL